MNSLVDFAIPHVLDSLALEAEQLLEGGAWNKWLADWPAFAQHARIEGMYKTRSTLLMLSVPGVNFVIAATKLASAAGNTFYVNGEKIQTFISRNLSTDTNRRGWCCRCGESFSISSALPLPLHYRIMGQRVLTVIDWVCLELTCLPLGLR
jgi:hypothetical protein